MEFTFVPKQKDNFFHAGVFIRDIQAMNVKLANAFVLLTENVL